MGDSGDCFAAADSVDAGAVDRLYDKERQRGKIHKK